MSNLGNCWGRFGVCAVALHVYDGVGGGGGG